MLETGSTLSQQLSVLAGLWWLLPLMLLIFLLQSGWLKGCIGEFLVNFAARLFLHPQEYHLIRNVTLPTESGSTRIDHIIVSRFGIFVVDSKNIKGRIYGSPDENLWTQQLFRSKRTFLNPLHQSYKRTKTLQARLLIEEDKLFPVVVFVGASRFKSEMPENVTEGLGYIRYIKSKQQVLLTESKVKQVIKQITTTRKRSTITTQREHAQHAREIIGEKSEQAAIPTARLCPKCGSPMRLRATSDPDSEESFWACSTFPKCTTIIPAENNASYYGSNP